ncbi:2-amino-4-hydroxy-6-hydroxymethyldihydropteridine diphosphokinase [Rhizosaccharibacter radicis]|uniref:2-amino-4-hydroxy-6-hydroxymethyldihydropteridine pyrophosphokinase n=1 Tax=Rhizosaccharibacter radicis TaxID=2782605 RepID=A0ABT1VV97_9PROT|nr:2-amino-4-hydroxy-6-hydroxymethyldihydropteridine diphosphokinase [Acetobacteraceae bacterium KSS12]
MTRPDGGHRDDAPAGGGQDAGGGERARGEGRGDAGILVAIGANLPGLAGGAADACLNAVDALRALPGLRVAAVSRWYESAPVPPSGQPPYVNGAVLLEPVAAMPDPATLLAGLQAIEAAFGRERGERNAARTLDLDIVAMAEIVRDAPDPVLPHPRAHERSFVLLPVRDVSPRWTHPRLGRDVDALIRDLPREALAPAAIRLLA